MKQLLIGGVVLALLLGSAPSMADNHRGGFVQGVSDADRGKGAPQHKKFLTSRHYDGYRNGGHREKHHGWKDKRGNHHWGHSKRSWKGKHGWGHGHRKHHYKKDYRKHWGKHHPGRYGNHYRYHFRYNAGYPGFSDGRLSIDLVGH